MDVEKYMIGNLPCEFYASDSYSPNKYLSTPYRLQEFCNKNETVLILSRVCARLKINYVKMCSYIVERRKVTKVIPFKDREYLASVGDLVELLVGWQDLFGFLQHFGVDVKAVKGLFKYASSYFFDLRNYKRFIEKRRESIYGLELENENFFKKIELKPSAYYNKEYVSSNKYRSDLVKSYVQENIKNATQGELSMKDMLDRYGVNYVFQSPCLVFGKTYIMDFYLPKYGVCIEVDGGYHNKETQIEKDIERSNNLSKSGILVVRFTNDEAIRREKVRDFFVNVLGLE